MKIKLAILFALAFSLLTPAYASIQVMGTRIIFNAKEKEQSVRINNVGETPSLIQVWIDSRKESKIDDKENVPFMITPPIARINTGKGKVLRIFSTDETAAKYPKDRETMLWINILDVPPEAEETDGKNLMNIAIRTRLKFFYRPEGLKGDLLTASQQVTWRMKKTASGYSFTGSNNSPYYISYASLKLNGDDANSLHGDVIEPFSSKIFEFKNVKSAATPVLTYTFISDLGAFITKEFKV
ncbi:fimbrial biogenesis chaperone [Rahnella aceris]|uniref:fimbrial biogenesis chaperone n=1 Tax=Rahnella sp. (strain Y9602) TaxID=2703885 RepID=UPI001C256C7E|nr:molecular chaperone [Rahnella aceris]MBU9851582.1 molecular chaperone [Rahnella aceris]